MAPRKQPRSLFDNSVHVLMDIINKACYKIYIEDGEYDYCKNGQRICELKSFLYTNLPARLINILCNRRRSMLEGPCIQLSVLAHPRITSLSVNPDTAIPHHYWLDLIPTLPHLVHLNLKSICTDEILAAIGENCLLLEELNAISRVDVRKSPFNATVLMRNVSDVGLNHLIGLKRLRVLWIDPPRNDRLRWRMGRCISQAGIRNLVSHLPSLEELRVESCDIGTTLVSGGSLHDVTLRKINCHFASPENIQKLLNICPRLRELSLTYLFGNESDEVLQELSASDARLHNLDLSFFKYSPSMSHLLYVKGAYITTFSLIEIDTCITFEGILTIGKCCPNLNKLRLLTPAGELRVPLSYKLNKSYNMFNHLKSLCLSFNSVDIKEILILFFKCANSLVKLDVKHQSIVNLDDMFVRLIQEGLLNSIDTIALDSSLILSVETVKYMIDKCDNLRVFMVNCLESDKTLQQYIRENNYDINLSGNYCG